MPYSTLASILITLCAGQTPTQNATPAPPHPQPLRTGTAEPVPATRKRYTGQFIIETDPATSRQTARFIPPDTYAARLAARMVDMGWDQQSVFDEMQDADPTWLAEITGMLDPAGTDDNDPRTAAVTQAGAALGEVEVRALVRRKGSPPDMAVGEVRTITLGHGPVSMPEYGANPILVGNAAPEAAIVSALAARGIQTTSKDVSAYLNRVLPVECLDRTGRALLPPGALLILVPSDSATSEAMLDEVFDLGDSAMPRGTTCIDDPLTGFGGGQGTPADPYVICNASEMDAMSLALNAWFVQTSDIDVAAYLPNFSPIPNQGEFFGGTYDGQRYSLINMHIYYPVPDMALFGKVSASGVIRNVRIENAYISGQSRSAGIASRNYGLIEHSSFDGTVIGSDYIGGIAGENFGTISKSSSTGSVIGVFSGVGGIAGYSYEGSSISNSYSNSSVTAELGYGAGLVGVGFVATITNSYSSGLVTGTGDGINGMVGYADRVNVVSSFWDIESSGRSTSAAGVGKTTAEMQLQSTFDPPWDFNTVWVIDEGVDYPRLRPVPCGVLGDIDENGIVELADLPLFVQVLLVASPICRADVNNDGKIDARDIPPFIELLLP